MTSMTRLEVTRPVAGRGSKFQGDHPDHKKGDEMDITKMGAKAAIARAYAGVPASLWEFKDPDRKKSPEQLDREAVLKSKIRKYCPGCNQGNTLHEIKPTKANGMCSLKCRSCGHLCNSPKYLLPKGPSQASSRVSRINANDRIAKAMEASEVMNAVESLPENLRLWALWVYTDPDVRHLEGMEGRLLSILVDEMDGVEQKFLIGLRANADAIRIISMHMNCYRSRQRCEKRLHNASSFAAAINCHRSQFTGTRLWARISREIEAKMGRMDSMALGPVAEVLQSLRDDDDVHIDDKSWPNAIQDLKDQTTG